MNVALLGHGTVGKGVTDIIENEKIEGIRIVRILTRTKRENNDERFTVDFGQIINDETIDTIVECMGGEEPAYSYVKECLEKGKNVISANKKMLARHMDLFELAKERNVKLLSKPAQPAASPGSETFAISAAMTPSFLYKGSSTALPTTSFPGSLKKI